MTRTLIAMVFVFLLGLSVHAKTPTDVLEPYKAYRAVLAEEDKVLAAEKTYEAWQKAEELMGDTKITGDLASNFADLEPRKLDKRDARDKVRNAYKRSIDLSHFHDELAADMEVQRRIDFLSWALQYRNPKQGRKYNTDALEAFIVEQEWMGTTYEGDMLSLKAQRAFYQRNWMKTEQYGREAMNVYEAAEDDLVSYFRFVVPIFYAKSLAEMDRPIEAVLAYQELMDSLESNAGHQNKVSDVTYAQWLTLKEQVLKESPDDPRIGQIKSYEMPKRRTALFSPPERVPPRFPSSFLQGKHSGYVTLKFDVDPEGKVINAIVTGSTNKSLDRAALKSVKKWRYSPGIPPEERKSLETTIRFEIQNISGKYFPVEPYKEYSEEL